MRAPFGILLAGGRGKRLALGAPKALAPFAGSTLVERARTELAASCERVVVVAPRAMELPVPWDERVPDAIDDAGPLSALVAGLEACTATHALVTAVDLPRFDRGALARLAGAWRGERALVPRPGGRLQPLAAVYAREAAGPLRETLDRGERALVPAVESLGPRVLDERELAALGLGPGTFADADTPEALAVFEREARERAR